VDAKRRALTGIVARLGYPGSEALLSLWDTMVDEREATWIAALPATAAGLSASTGEPVAEVRKGLEALYSRGLVVIDPEVGPDPRYLPIENAGVLMDLVLFDRRYLEYGHVFLDTWQRFYNQELVHEHDYPERDQRPFRVVPVLEQVTDQRTALPYERIVDEIRQAQRLSVEHCPCRTRERLCGNPTETCLGLNEVAEYMIAREIGREITAEEALGILEHSEALGLMHLTENSTHPRVICNCCPCCCVFLRAMTAHGKERVIASSQYVARVDAEACVQCGRCVTRCHVGAIAVEAGPARVDERHCVGCGLCVSTCPSGALSLIPLREQSGVQERPSGFGSLLARTPAS